MFQAPTRELDELGGGRNRLTAHLKPVAYREGGSLYRIAPDWVASGVAERPHIVSAAPLMVSVGDDGLRRLHPTREIDRYLEIGTPYVKVGGQWRSVGFTSATRTANRITWSRAQADLSVVFGGHFCKLDLELKGGYVPEDNLVAFPVGLTGLTRSGLSILRDGAPVALLRKPVVYDAGSNRPRLIPVPTAFQNIQGKPYMVMTLPSLVGMARPVIDPTLDLQPDATAGIDTTLQESAPTADNSTWANIWINTQANTGGHKCNAILKFDLSSLPASPTYNSIQLTLACYYEGDAKTVHARRVLSGNSSWTEAGACWSYRVSTTAWAGSVGCNTESTDCAAASMGSLSVSTIGDKIWVLDATEFESMRANNYGLLMRATDGVSYSDYSKFQSSDYATAADRPQLVVDYTEAGGSAIVVAPQLVICNIMGG